MSTPALAYVLKRDRSPGGARLNPYEKLLWLLLADDAIDGEPGAHWDGLARIDDRLLTASCMTQERFEQTIRSLVSLHCLKRSGDFDGLPAYRVAMQDL